MPTADTSPLGSSIQSLLQAIASGNSAQFQEALREFNLNYANSVAQNYGQNFGPGVPAPTTASTLAAGQATGSIGYIPGYSGLDVGQTQSNLQQMASTAQAAAGLTGFYAAPAQSQWSPGTFLRIDPSSYDYGRYGDQLDYVTSSGQLQRVTPQQAAAMGWNGNMGQLGTLGVDQALRLEAAAPQNVPQQTLTGLTTYSNLNAQAQNQALAAAGATGLYYAPQTINAPGTNAGGGKFSDLDAATQQAYYQAHGGDWQSAMNAWVADSNRAMQQATQAAGGTWNPNQPAAPVETLAGQQQAYAQQMGAITAAANLQANPFRQAQVMGQAGRLLSGLPTASFNAPNTVTGVGTAGGNTQGGMGYLSQMIDDIRNPTANTATAQSFLDQTPTPNKLDSASFLRSTPSTQNLILQAMQEKYGLDPTDSMQQIKNTLPQFSAPSTLGTVRRG